MLLSLIFVYYGQKREKFLSEKEEHVIKHHSELWRWRSHFPLFFPTVSFLSELVLEEICRSEGDDTDDMDTDNGSWLTAATDSTTDQHADATDGQFTDDDNDRTEETLFSVTRFCDEVDVLKVDSAAFTEDRATGFILLSDLAIKWWEKMLQWLCSPAL